VILYRKANLADVSQLVELERTHVNAELGQFDPSLQGHALTAAQVTLLINQHWIMLALDNLQIVGYVIAAKWDFFAKQALYQKIIQKLPQLDIERDGVKLALTQTNSCQYGPIWIAEKYRGQGIFTHLVNHIADAVSSKVRYLVAYIAEDNNRSFRAHTQYADMQVVDFFSFQQRDFYLLVRVIY
jgi:GNAT superfamily N-acetyltransferase